MKRTMFLVLAILLVISISAGNLSVLPGAAKAKAPKYTIVMISDGWGYNHINAASYYEYGEANMQVYNEFPFKKAMRTYSANGWGYDPSQAWTDFNYLKLGATDSASAATAMSTGVKNYDGTIGVDVNYQPLKHASAYAEEVGKATGVVTSVEFSHATPAGFVAHNASRNNYTQIATEMIMNSATDVIMGCGNPWYYDSGAMRTTPSYTYIGQSTWGETLLIVTGDHETGYLTGPGAAGLGYWTPIVNNGAGNMPGVDWNSGNHTNSLIPFFAKGDDGRYFNKNVVGIDPVHGKYIDNTSIGTILIQLFNGR